MLKLLSERGVAAYTVRFTYSCLKHMWMQAKEKKIIGSLERVTKISWPYLEHANITNLTCYTRIVLHKATNLFIWTYNRMLEHTRHK